MMDREHKRSELSDPIKRNIKRKEAYLEKKCGKVWSFTNPQGEQYLFASFGASKLLVTVGYFSKNIHKFVPCG